MKGGAISTDWNTVKQKYQEDILGNSAFFKERLINYYNKKIEKYQKMISSYQEESVTNLQLDAQNKMAIWNSVSELKGNNKELDQSSLESLQAISEVYQEQILKSGDIINDTYKTNNKLLNYDQVQTLILERIKNLNEGSKLIQYEGEYYGFEECLTKFLEICDTKLNTENLNIVRIEITEQMLAINSGIVNLKVYSPFNLVLTGNPGIGKSFNAAIIADAFKFSLLLAKGSVYNIKKPDIIGQYVGQTAPLVYKQLVKGLESVIFIDEAYSIAGPKQESTNSYDKFGVEALDALTDFTSEHQSLMSVIVAGYPSEMKTQFLEVNSGLPRRFPSNILLSRYNLTDIINISMNESGKLLGDVSAPVSDDKFSPLQIQSIIYSLVLLLTNYFNYSLPVIQLSEIKDKMASDDYKLDTIGVSKIEIINFLSSNVKIRFSDLNGQEQEILLFSTNLEGDRLPFNFKNTNETPGIEWFVLSYILMKTTNIPDGDLFKNQAADLIDYINNLVNYLVTFYNVSSGGDTYYTQWTYMINQFLKYINSRVPNLNVSASINSSTSTFDIVFEDSQNFIQNVLINPVVGKEPQATNTLQQVIKYAIYDKNNGFYSLKKLNEDYAGRPFKLFTLQQLKSMQYNLDTFFNAMGSQQMGQVEEPDDL